MADDFEIVGRVVIDSSGAASLQGLSGQLDQMSQKSSGLTGIMSGLGGAVQVAIGGLMTQAINAGLGAIKGFADGIMEAGMQAQEVQAQLDAVLKSTGGAAGVTKDQVNGLADSLSKLTRFDDEAIGSAENMLLTFTNIGKDVFPDATKAVLDMAQATGTDLKGASIQLGKALNDPEKGITALTRVGVTFTDSQKDMIKSMVEAGNVAGAQKLILSELSKEFGGSAEAAGKTFGGSMDRLKTQVGNVQEKIFNALLPTMTKFGTSLADIFTSPAIQKGIDFLVEQLGVALPYVFGFATDFLEDFSANLNDGMNIVEALANSIAGPLGDSFLSFGKAFDALLSGDWDGFFKWLGVGVNEAFSGIWKSINDFIFKTDWFGLFSQMGSEINKAVTAMFGGKDVGAGLGEWFSNAGKFIQDNLTDLGKNISNFAHLVDWKGLSKDIANGIKGIDWKSLGKGVGDFGKGVSVGIGTLLVETAKAVGEAVSDIDWNVFQEAGAKAASAFMSGLTGMDFESANSVWARGFQGLVKSQTFYLNILGGLNKKSWADGQKGWENFFTGLGRETSRAFRESNDGWNNFFAGLWNTFTKAWSDGLTGWGNFFTGLGAKFSEQVAKFGKAGTDMVNGLWKGIQDAWKTITSGLTGLISALPEAIKKLLGLTSAGESNSLNLRSLKPGGGAGGSSFASSSQTNYYGGASTSTRSQHIGPVINNYFGSRPSPDATMKVLRRATPLG